MPIRFHCDCPQADRLTGACAARLPVRTIDHTRTPASARRHGDQRMCSLSSLAATKQAAAMGSAGHPTKMQNGCPAGSANTYRGSSWSSVRSSSSVAPRASALSRWICKSCGSPLPCPGGTSAARQRRTNSRVRRRRSAGTPAVVHRACSATRASHYPAGQAGWGAGGSSPARYSSPNSWR
jgi:hypothetical protein